VSVIGFVAVGSAHNKELNYYYYYYDHYHHHQQRFLAARHTGKLDKRGTSAGAL
jgi:hypothetical protein